MGRYKLQMHKQSLMYIDSCHKIEYVIGVLLLTFYQNNYVMNTILMKKLISIKTWNREDMFFKLRQQRSLFNC